MLTLDPTTRATLPYLRHHPWVKVDKEPLQPLCEEDSEVTVKKPWALGGPKARAQKV